MLSIDTQEELAEWIMTVAREEKALEVIRQVLAEQALFTPYTAFMRIDKRKRGFIDKADLKEFLQANGFKTTAKKCGFVVLFYDLDKDDKLSFKEFLSIVLPVDNPKLRQEAVERENYSLENNEPLPYNVEYALARIFEKEVEMSEVVERKKQSLLNRYDINMQNAFKSIDARHTRYVTFENLASFLKKRGVSVQPEDVAAFVRRFDHDRDCRISYPEFVASLLPADPKTKTKPSYITPTKSFQAGAELNGKKQSVAGRSVRDKSFSGVMRTPERTPERPRSRIGLRSQGGRISTASKRAVTPLPARSRKESAQKSATKMSVGKSHKKSSVNKSVRKTPQRCSPFNPAKNDVPSVYGLMELQLEMEKNIELVKEELALHKDITVPKICVMLDPEAKGYIGAVDLLDFLRKLGLSPEREAAYTLFGRFDKDLDGRLDYSDIADMIVPLDEEYANVINSRAAKAATEKITADSMGVLTKLMRTYLEAESENERQKARLEGLDLKKAFEECDFDDAGYFTLEHVHVAVAMARWKRS